MTVLQDVGSESAMLDKIARLTAENELLKARAKAQATSRIRLKVSEKGAVQLLGIGSKFGITLYAQTWLTVLDIGDQIKDFIKANKDSLSFRGETE